MRLTLFLVSFASTFAGEFTTYIGDLHEYQVAQVITDSVGNTYLTGSRTIGSVSDIFVTKLDPLGAIAFTTTLGGKGIDRANAIALDPAGNLFIAGSTSSSNFPLRGALQTQLSTNGQAGFIVKLSPDGSRLLYSTYFGGLLGPSWINAIAADSAGNMYVTGSTMASDFTATAGLPNSHPAFVSFSPAFVAKISAAGDRIVWSALIGGDRVACGAGSSCFLSTRSTIGNSISLDAAGNAYVAGNTNVTNLPATPGAMVGDGGIGGFVLRINAGGTALDYLTYIGTANYILAPWANPGNIVNSLTVDATGIAFVVGSTNDPKFPATRGVVQETYSGPPPDSTMGPGPQTDAFVAKLNPTGSSMVWATFLGGAAPDAARSIALDAAGNAWVTGTTSSASFPDTNGWAKGGAEFLVELNSNGTKLLYSARNPGGTTLGGVAVDGSGVPHVAGSTGLVSTLLQNEPIRRHIAGVVNSAWGDLSGRVAPGELISIYGPNVGPVSEVTLNGQPATLLYVSQNQINAVVPFGLAPSVGARLRIDTLELPVTVTASLPEIFRNLDGSAAAVNEDGTLNSAAHPAKPGSLVAIWATGAGSINCCQVSPSSEVTYAGPAPGLVAGVLQINFRVPTDVTTSRLSITLTSGGISSAPAEIKVSGEFLSPME